LPCFICVPKITKALQQSDTIINKNQRKFLIQKKPQPPDLRAQIKLQKSGQPIRPILNNRNAPGYKISKVLVKKLNNAINLKNHYTVKDSITLANEQIKINIYENHRMVTFDIKVLYVNIPIGQTLEIANNLIMENNIEQEKNTDKPTLDTILKQNYFAFDDNIYQPEKGISMGSPITNIIAEIFLQDLETNT